MRLRTNVWSARRRATALLAVLGMASMLPLFADGTPQNLPVSQNWSNALLITAADDWSDVAGFEGVRGDGLTAATGANPQLLLADDTPGVIDVNPNEITPNTFSTGGVTEFALSDPVVALAGSATADAPYLRLTVSTTGIAGVRVRYTLRDVDGSADNAVQPVALHYRVGVSGDWTNVPAAFVADATTGPNLATATTPVDVTLPAAVDNQPVVQLRVMTTNAVGNDEWVGIDDILVEATTAPTTPTITGATGTPGTVEHGQTLVIAATAAPGSNPASTTLSVVADATSLGGLGTLPLLDNGLAPDAVAGDLVFSGQTVVAASAGVGLRAIPLAVTDDLGRTGGGTLTVNVVAPTQTLGIHDIQGAGQSSPYVGQTVRTQGVLTARKFNGYYLQSESGAEDADAATSEGIFVFTSSAPSSDLQPGDLVSVMATVTEFIPSADPASPPLTELTSATAIEIGAASLPAPVVLTSAFTDPNGGLQQLERLEGMLVSAASITAVSGSAGTVNETNDTATNNGVFYAVLTGTPRPEREGGIPAMDPLLTCAAGTGCTIPVFDQNPELLRVDADAMLGVTAPVVTAGAVMTNVTAVVDYGFRSYTLLPTAPLVPAGLAVGTAARLRAGGEFTVASFNLQRLFDTTNDPGGDPVPTATAYANRLTKLSAAIRSYLHAPDILGVQEAENLTVLQQLAARIDADAAAAGQPVPGYTAHLVEGNDVGGIDVGFLTASRISVLDIEQHGPADTFTNPVTGAQDLLNDRPSLSIRATVAAEPGTLPAEVVVVVNHLRSLNGVEEADGRVRAKRLAQAEYVARTLGTLRATYPGVPVMSVGDFNAFEVNDGYVDVLGVARGVPAPATDVVLFGADLLASDFLLAPAVAGTPAGQTYSYVFEGSAQSLDHVLVSAEAAPLLAAFDHARINADFPEIFRGDAARVERTSDHDPAIAYFRFPRPAAATITLGNLSQTYTGSPLSVTATTEPAGLAVALTNGTQTNAGSYAVTATITDPNYTGSASGTFTIAKAAATVTLSNLAVPFTGAPQSPTVTTTPTGLPVTLTGAPQTAAGSYTVTASVDSPNYQGSSTGTFVITSPPTGLSLTATPSTVSPGQGTALFWNAGPGATNVSISPGYPSVPPVGGVGVYPSATTTYTLRATRPGGQVVSTTVIVIVTGSTAPPAPTATLSAAPIVISAGQSSTLTWTTSNAASVSIAPGIGAVGPSGSRSVSPTTTTTYTITATNAAGASTTATVTVTVGPPSPGPTATINAIPSTVTRGQGAVLFWSSTNGTTFSLMPGYPSVPYAGGVAVYPTTTTTYTFTARNAAGQATTATATVVVQ